MFTDFQPEPRRLSVVREGIDARKTAVEARWAEVIHFGLIVADQDAAGRVDELSRVDYLAARERWETAVVELDVERTAAIAENSLSLIHAITETARRMEVMK